jgi:hypothetical protein
VLCWIATGCTDGIIDYETGGDSPYTYFYTPPKTPPGDLHTLVDKRIGAYKTLIKKCKKHLSLTEEVEKLSYKEIKKAYLKFSTTHHPDKGGEKAIFQKGGGAWDALNETLGEDDENGQNKLGEEKLKKVEEPLLTYLNIYLKTHIEKNIETYR